MVSLGFTDYIFCLISLYLVVMQVNVSFGSKVLFVGYLLIFNFFVNVFLQPWLFVIGLFGLKRNKLCWPSNIIFLKVTQLLLTLSLDKMLSQSTSARKLFIAVNISV